MRQRFCLVIAVLVAAIATATIGTAAEPSVDDGWQAYRPGGYAAAAAGGDVGAQYIIGSFYEHGDGVARDLKRALDWYVLAAQQGDVGAAAQAKDVARRLAESGVAR